MGPGLSTPMNGARLMALDYDCDAYNLIESTLFYVLIALLVSTDMVEDIVDPPSLCKESPKNEGEGNACHPYTDLWNGCMGDWE